MPKSPTVRANNKSPSPITATHFAFLWRRSGVFSTFAFFTPFFCHDRFNRYCFCHILSFLLLVVCPATAPGKIVCFGLLKTVENRLPSMRKYDFRARTCKFFLIRSIQDKAGNSFGAPMLLVSWRVSSRNTEI
jgi:hypothetical protein